MSVSQAFGLSFSPRSSSVTMHRSGILVVREAARDFRWLVLGRLPQVELPTLRSQPHQAVIPSSQRSENRSPISSGVRDAYGDQLRPAHNSGDTVPVDRYLEVRDHVMTGRSPARKRPGPPEKTRDGGRTDIIALIVARAAGRMPRERNRMTAVPIKDSEVAVRCEEVADSFRVV
jgi:hypothetical protein